MSCIRPEIAFSSGFTSHRENPYWDVVHRLMRYLKRTMNLSMLYTEYPAMIGGSQMQADA